MGKEEVAFEEEFGTTLFEGVEGLLKLRLNLRGGAAAGVSCFFSLVGWDVGDCLSKDEPGGALKLNADFVTGGTFAGSLSEGFIP